MGYLYFELIHNIDQTMKMHVYEIIYYNFICNCKIFKTIYMSMQIVLSGLRV